MPRRRRGWGKGARVAYGLSMGAQQFLQQMMRDMGQQRAAAATAEREEARDLRTQRRIDEQTKATTRAGLVGKFGDVAAGTLEPDALMAMAQAQSVDLDPTQVQGLRPPMRRKLESTVGKSISGATSPEQLGESDILGQILAADDRVTPADDEPGMRVGGLRPEAYEYVARAEDKAHALRQPQRDLDASLAALPAHLQPFADMIKGGVMGKIGPGDMQSPADREASEIRVRRASIAPQSQSSLYEKIETVDEAGNPIIKYLTPDEVRQMGGVRGQPRTTAKASGPATVQAILGEIDTLSQAINQGGGGPLTTLTGYGRRGAAAMNLDNEVAEYDALVQGFTPMIARAVGHTGVLTQADVESVRALFPKPTDNAVLAQHKLARVRRLMEEIAQASMPNATETPAATNPLYQQYLTKKRGGQ